MYIYYTFILQTTTTLWCSFRKAHSTLGGALEEEAANQMLLPIKKNLYSKGGANHVTNAQACKLPFDAILEDYFKKPM